MNEKRKITDEEKRQVARLFKGIIPNGTLDEDDILWIMNEVENGNRDISFEEFMKAKQEREGSHKSCTTCKYYDIPYRVEDINFPCRSCIGHNKWAEKKSERVHRCVECKYQTCKANEEPCKSCCEWTHPGSLTMDSKWEPKEEDNHLCKDCKFAENPIFIEPCHSCFKISNTGDDLYHTNWQPKPDESEEVKKDVQDAVFPEFEKIFTALESLDNMLLDVKVDMDHEFERTRSALDHIQERFEEYEKQQKDILEKLTETLESANSKLDILDQRMHDLRNSQILKDMKYVTQEKAVEKDVLEKLNNIEQVVMKNSVGINTTYEKASAVHDEVCKDEDICKDCNYYGMCSGYEGDMIYCKDFKKKDISSAKEPPKFKVGDIVKVTNDSKNNDFFVCRIKWSEHSKTWNYLISMDLEDISGAFWRTEKWLTKSEDHSEPLFKVGDKVKLKAGKTVYTVLSVTHFICGERIVYRYKISHSATTPHYENENRLIKA